MLQQLRTLELDVKGRLKLYSRGKADGKMKFTITGMAARYSAFKLKELDKSEEPKALLSVDSMLNWSDHEGGDEEKGAAQVYRMIAGDDDDTTSDASGDVSDVAAEFALMGLSSQLGLYNKPMWHNVANIPSFVPRADMVSCLLVVENPHKNKDLGIVDSGCSRSMTVTKEKEMEDFVKILEGYSGKAWIVNWAFPPNSSQNDHNCVACNKGKQHKASYKAITAVSTISKPLQLLHMDYFGPTSIRSIDHKYYSLVVTDDLSREKLMKGFIVGVADHCKAYRGLGHEWYFDFAILTDFLGYTTFKSNSTCMVHKILHYMQTSRNNLRQADMVPAGSIDPAASISAGSIDPAASISAGSAEPFPTSLSNLVLTDETSLPHGHSLGSSDKFLQDYPSPSDLCKFISPSSEYE
ncbi:hypothetical protein Tco_0010200 [Tanacetum coccineum]